MQAWVMLGMLVVIGTAVALTMSYALGHGRGVIAGIFGLDREPGWPRGVQEEDPPPVWRQPPR